MRFIDLSQPLFDGAPNCPAHPPVAIRTETHSGNGLNSWQMEFLDFASHTGSHIDAPLHKMQNGQGIENLSLESFCGPALLLDLRGLVPQTPIGRELLEAATPTTEWRDKIVLLATGWGEKRAMTPEWLHQSPFLSEEGAQFLVENGVRAVGIDHFSIGGGTEPQNALTHVVLLGAGLWVVEELRFPEEIFDIGGEFTFQALPIHLRGTNGLQFSGAPCRPVAVLP